MNQVESTLQAITTSIAVLENSENPDQSLLESLRKERDSILGELEVYAVRNRKICIER